MKQSCVSHLNYETQLHFAHFGIAAHILQTVCGGYSVRLYAMCCFCVFPQARFGNTQPHG